MKIHFSITLDTSGIFVKYLVYIFVSTCFVMQNAKSLIHLKLKVKTDIPSCIAKEELPWQSLYTRYYIIIPYLVIYNDQGHVHNQ